MDPLLERGQEFCYCIKAPHNEAFDVLNLNVKIDTSWIFQDLEAAKDAYAMESEGEANSAEVETLNLRIKQLEKSEEKLRHILEDYMNSDRVLRNRYMHVFYF